MLDAVDWKKVSKGEPEAWLYFYEEFPTYTTGNSEKRPALTTLRRKLSERWLR